MKKIAAIQSNYIPWKGYFDIINAVDEFVLYDDVQYTPKNWRNRNQLKSPQGLKWLSIPVKPKKDLPLNERIIDQMIVSDHDWPNKHWGFIQSNYSKARHFKANKAYFQEAYEEARSLEYLSDINRHFIEKICHFLEIDTKITFSSEYSLTSTGKSDRPLELAIESQAKIFVSGETASEYYELDKWQEAGVNVEFFSYDGYEEYWQPYPPFTHYVSTLDLIFNTGDKAREFLLSNLNH